MSTRYLRTLQLLCNRKSPNNIPFNLKKPKQISQLFNNPFNNYKIIHVAGTNGKGSVCTKLSSVLKLCKFKTGLTLSPHTSCVRERIQINNEMISEKDFCDGIDEILHYETTDTELSFFELITQLSFNHFTKENVDYAVIEVGLGGRFDATNIITNPCLSVITSISLDHTHILGETTDEITMEKAGIIKRNSPIVIGPTVNPKIISDLVSDKSLLHIVDNENCVSFDEENIEIVKKGIDVLCENDTHFKETLHGIGDINSALLTKPICRFERIECKSVQCIMDCAHNLCAMEKLFDLLRLKYDRNVYDYRVIIGMSKGKNVGECLRIVDRYAKYIHFVSINNVNKRSLTLDELKECYEGINGENKRLICGEIGSDQSCNGIMKYALNECVRSNENIDNKQQILIVCGSLYIMSEAREVLGCNDIVDPIDFSNAEFGKRLI